MRLLVLTIALGGASFLSAQNITEVGPAASYIPTGLPGGGIAQGSFFYIKGSGLGPATGVSFTSDANPYTIGTELAGVRVRLTFPGTGTGSTTLDAYPYYVSANQINAIMPSNAQVGTGGTVSVIYNGVTANYPITIVRSAFGIFTLNSAGSGPAVVTDASTYQVKTFTTALRPGDVATLWGTGLGPVLFPDNRPAEFVRLETDVKIFVGGKEATLQFAGRAPGFSGLDQINFVVPAGVTGCAVPLVVRIGNVASNFASVPVTNSGNICSDPGGLSASDLESAQSGNLTIGSVGLQRTSIRGTTSGITFDVISDAAFGAFQRYNFNSAIRSDSFALPPVGSCAMSFYSGSTDPGDPILPTNLDAGAKLTLRGASGTRDVNKQSGFYTLSGGAQVISGLPGGIPGVPGGSDTSFLTPGNYTIEGPGGADVGQFSVNLTFPQPLTWTNQTTSIPRSQDFRVTWSGGGNDFVMITGASSNATSNVTGLFTCLASASAGSFTIPSYVLSALPSSSPVQGTPTDIFSIASYGQPVRFNASGLTYGVATAQTAVGANVTFQ